MWEPSICKSCIWNDTWYASPKTACSWGKRTASQGKGQPPSDQGKTNEVRSKKRREEDEAEGDQSEDHNDEEQDDDEEKDEKDSSKYSNGEMESLMKSPAETSFPAKSQADEDDNDEGKEGIANDERSFPHNVDVHCKVHESPNHQLGLRPAQAAQ